MKLGKEYYSEENKKEFDEVYSEYSEWYENNITTFTDPRKSKVKFFLRSLVNAFYPVPYPGIDQMKLNSKPFRKRKLSTDQRRIVMGANVWYGAAEQVVENHKKVGIDEDLETELMEVYKKFYKSWQNMYIDVSHLQEEGKNYILHDHFGGLLEVEYFFPD